MRAVEFRGFSITESKWVFGSLNVYNRGKNSHLITSLDGFQSWVVDTESVGQFIGLTDKHGKKIFENDVFKLKDSRGYIIWHFDGFQIRWTKASREKLENRHGVISTTLTPSKLVQMEVIGDTFSKPELIVSDNVIQPTNK